MNYTLCIESDTGKIDIIDPDVIKKVEIKVFQDDKCANDRSDQLYNTLTISGVLTDKSQKETKEIFEWSMKTDQASVYKTVEIKIYNQQTLLRDYYLKNMYCAGYAEIFNEAIEEGGSIGSFVLQMKQRKGSIDTIKVDIE